jgi:AbrB family looped-hinge helix DNA binding protein
MRITAKGQVTIPQEIREKLGLLPDTEVEFEIDGDAVRITRAPVQQARGRALIAHLRGRAGRGPSTDEIMALVRGDD